MTKAQDLGKKLHSLANLREVVGAMKSLSAQHFRETRDAIEPMRAYRREVERILALASEASSKAPEGPVGLLVVGGDFGLCGAYHSLLADEAARRRDAAPKGPFFVVGHRTAAMLARRGHRADRVYDAPTGVAGIASLLVPLVEALFEAYASERLSRFDVVSSRFEGVGAHPPKLTALLPIEAPPPEGAAMRVRYVAPDELASAARRELLYVHLHELLVDALASEHGARLAATQSAESFLDDRSSLLGRRLVAARREGSTQEMLEVIAGARARTSGGRSG